MESYTFVFFGIVGSGKGTQVKLLIDFLNDKDGRESVYAGTGEGFRQLVASGGYAGSLVKESMGKGELITDFLTNAMFTNILVSSLTPTKHLIADGYPRKTTQSEVFEEMMKFFRRDHVKIIYIEVGKDQAMKRNLLRGRSDDTEVGIAKRFDEYVNNVIPAMNYFKGRENYEVYAINGEQSVEDVHREIIAVLGF